MFFAFPQFPKETDAIHPLLCSPSSSPEHGSHLQDSQKVPLFQNQSTELRIYVIHKIMIMNFPVNQTATMNCFLCLQAQLAFPTKTLYDQGHGCKLDLSRRTSQMSKRFLDFSLKEAPSLLLFPTLVFPRMYIDSADSRIKV